MISSAFHKILSVFCYSNLKRFEKSTSLLKETQLQILSHILNKSDEGVDYEKFCDNHNLSTYENWQTKIDASIALKESLNHRSVKYYQPTSGSTSKEKWIPYTDLFLEELNNASLAWIADLYREYPEIKKGTHYWSLSWLPDKFRKKINNDDLEVVNFFERQILKRVMALPWDVSKFPTSYTSILGTAVGLICRRDLSLISVWSPTYLLSLINFIKNEREVIFLILSNRNWNNLKELDKFKLPKISKKSLSHFEDWNGIDNTIFEKLWPNLALISCWDSSTSAKWISKLKVIFPNVKFQGKGLWATEGVVTFPFANKYPLAVNSHFYEFINLDNNETLPSWKIEKGMRVQPVITTGSGLIRYKLEDELLVVNFYKQVPCFEFIGRLKDIDLVGEKISFDISEKIINKINDQFDVESICLIANDSKEVPFYSVLTNKSDRKERIEEYLEDELLKNFHYSVARELGQLGPAKVDEAENPWQEYKSINLRNGKIEGNIKHEPLIRVEQI